MHTRTLQFLQGHSPPARSSAAKLASWPWDLSDSWLASVTTWVRVVAVMARKAFTPAVLAGKVLAAARDRPVWCAWCRRRCCNYLLLCSNCVAVGRLSDWQFDTEGRTSQPRHRRRLQDADTVVRRSTDDERQAAGAGRHVPRLYGRQRPGWRSGSWWRTSSRLPVETVDDWRHLQPVSYLRGRRGSASLHSVRRFRLVCFLPGSGNCFAPSQFGC